MQLSSDVPVGQFEERRNRWYVAWTEWNEIPDLSKQFTNSGIFRPCESDARAEVCSKSVGLATPNPVFLEAPDHREQVAIFLYHLHRERHAELTKARLKRCEMMLLLPGGFLGRFADTESEFSEDHNERMMIVRDDVVYQRSCGFPRFLWQFLFLKDAFDFLLHDITHGPKGGSLFS